MMATLVPPGESGGGDGGGGATETSTAVVVTSGTVNASMGLPPTEMLWPSATELWVAATRAMVFSATLARSASAAGAVARTTRTVLPPCTIIVTVQAATPAQRRCSNHASTAFKSRSSTLPEIVTSKLTTS